MLCFQNTFKTQMWFANCGHVWLCWRPGAPVLVYQLQETHVDQDWKIPLQRECELPKLCAWRIHGQRITGSPRGGQKGHSPMDRGAGGWSHGITKVRPDDSFNVSFYFAPLIQTWKLGASVTSMALVQACWFLPASFHFYQAPGPTAFCL